MYYPIYLRSFYLAIFLLLPFICYPQKWRVTESLQEINSPGGYVTNMIHLFTYHSTSSRGSNYSNDTINYDMVDIPDSPYPPGKGYKTYNSDNQLLSETYFELNPSNEWRGRQADSFFYSNGKLIRHDEYHRMSLGSIDSLALAYEYDYGYDANGLLRVMTRTGYSGKLRPQPNARRNYYSYDSAGRLQEDSIVVVRNGVWTELEMYRMDYDSNGNILYKEKYIWDSTHNKKLANRTNHYYFQNGLLDRDSMTVFYDTGSHSVQLASYAYNAAGQRIADTGTYIYPQFNRKLTIYKYTSFGHYSVVEEGSVDDSGNVYFGVRTTYTYGHYWPVNTPNTEKEGSDLTIYPNPAYNKLFIKNSGHIESGGIYNGNGQLMIVIQPGMREIDIIKLPPGNYFLQLTIDGKTITEHFSVIK
ncbi:MAG: T9SS type A sorting domain-containing protein [Taibaiella sp.]|nr:T9SS type A sorting domain-containing protein [Taibaiella sp.]